MSPKPRTPTHRSGLAPGFACVVGVLLLATGLLVWRGGNRPASPVALPAPPQGPAAAASHPPEPPRSTTVPLQPPVAPVPQAAAVARRPSETATPPVPVSEAPHPPVKPSTEALAVLLNDSVPVDERRSKLSELARQGDAATLMALGGEGVYLSDAAVEALGQLGSPTVAAYLTEKLTDANPRMVAAALRSLAQVSGKQAVPAIATTLARNRVRPDGFQDMVCAAGVQALGATKSAAAVPALAAELTETVGTRLSYDYGSHVVAAIRDLGAPTATPALQAYRDRLATILAAAPANPLGKHYLEAKIGETDAALASLRKRP